MKIVINTEYGGYSLSDIAVLKYAELKNLTLTTDPEDDDSYYTQFYLPDGKEFDEYDIPRNDSYLVQAIELLGDLADGSHANLKVVEIPDDILWVICNEDGLEWIAEQHRTWH